MSARHGQHRPPDPSKGDESTIGGYAAVHDRPAAFEGSDGFSYSVELMTEATDDSRAPWSAFFLFIRWARMGAQSPEGHLESEYVAGASTEEEALRRIGATPLGEVKALLDRLIAARDAAKPARRWWDVMHDEADAESA